VRVARRLDRDLILRTQAVREHPQALATDLDLPGVPDRPAFPDRDLRELAMYIQTDASPTHRFTSIDLRFARCGSRRANDTYGSALEAQPGKSQGRPSTNPRSQRNV
jgi:hypothetical protein